MKPMKDWTVRDDNNTTVTVKARSLAQAEAIARLRCWLKPGDKVFCVLRHRSASGMSRVIQLTKFDGEGADFGPRYLGYNAAVALGWRYDNKREGIKVQGCGMDMGFATVYELGRVLWPEGFKVDGRGRNGDTSGWDSDGGYALKSEWL